MSRALILGLLCLLTLAGCTSAPAPKVVIPPPQKAIVAATDLQPWLDQQTEVAAMDSDQLSTALAAMDRPDSVDGLYFYALLNQYAQDYNAWTLARDIFRLLGQDESLSPQRRQLATIFEAYNQTRINWYQRYGQLQTQYDEQQQQLRHKAGENTLLEQKIQAITDLETTISTRKEP